MNALNWSKVADDASVFQESDDTVWRDVREVSLATTGNLCRFTTRCGQRFIITAPFSIQLKEV